MDFAETALLCIILGTVLKEKEKPKRKLWSRKWLLRRRQKGCYENLMRELALEDAEGYRRWQRMNTASFEYLLSLVSPYISGRDTNMRIAITAGEKLAVTLRYLASGETQSSLSFQFRIVQNTISGIKLVCNALVKVLSRNHLHVPSTKTEWEAKDNFLRSQRVTVVSIMKFMRIFQVNFEDIANIGIFEDIDEVPDFMSPGKIMSRKVLRPHQLLASQ
ncbi:hypothetical protein HNY73_007649 [Argiope bruennichi]|uniref:Uncharacterized protein n=1 Tax=Argiope bruennichi TaxID=94029 RepID=A0A8T0FK33_ARGBR|nr:hypothetical protein HNY73_007649 [Argiope bruennichi]